MPIAPPIFPKSLELSAWRAAAKKDDIPEISDIEDALSDIKSVAGKIKWAELDPSFAKDINDFDDGYDYSFQKNTVPLYDSLEALVKQLRKHDKELKKFKFADTCSAAAKAFQESINDYRERADSELKKLLAKNAKNAKAEDEADDEEDDDNDNDEDTEVYDLRSLLRKAKKHPLKFTLGKVTPTAAYPLKYQLYISRQNLNKNKIAQLWPQFGKPKILAKGIVTFGPDPDDDNEEKFLYLCKTPPQKQLAKLIRKVLKFHKCSTFTNLALRQMKKGEDPDPDTDNQAIEIDAADLADADIGDDQDDSSDTSETPSNAAGTLGKLGPTIKQAIKAAGPGKTREQLTGLVMLARRQIDDKQEAKAATTVKAIIQFLHKPAAVDAKSETKSSADIFPKMSGFLKKMVEDFKKAGVKDKRIVSEFGTLGRRAAQNIKDKKQAQTAEALQGMERIIKTAAGSAAAAKMQKPTPGAPPPRAASAAGAPASEQTRKLSPFVKFNVARIQSWNSAQTKAKSQIEAFEKAVIKAAQGEDDVSEIESNVKDLMKEITQHGDDVTDALDNLATSWSKAKSASKDLNPDEINQIEAEHNSRRQDVGKLLDDYQAALDRHEITKQLDDNPFGSFGITTTIQTAIQKLKDALL